VGHGRTEMTGGIRVVQFERTTDVLSVHDDLDDA
jgi:hypothetical protein